MFEVFTNIKKAAGKWGEINSPNFLNISFLEIYYNYHKNIKHLFFIDTNMRLYAHIFKLKFKKTTNYLEKKSLRNIILNIINFDVLYLTNSFITNIPSYKNKKKININQLLNSIKHKYTMIIIPDFLFRDLIINTSEYTKIEVEEEMVIHIKKKWKNLEGYMLDLKKKYRNKIKKIIKETSNIEIRTLTHKNIVCYKSDIQNLFTQVVSKSRFKGPTFNTDAFNEFVKQGFMKVDGYFLENKLIGFTSEIEGEKMLYSYFVGFDKNLNKTTPIYGRILIENIRTSIKLNKEKLVLGRTANEYKSNFGAIPIRSFIYLRLKNKLLQIILKPIYNNLKIRKWTQRKPFKKQEYPLE